MGILQKKSIEELFKNFNTLFYDFFEVEGGVDYESVLTSKIIEIETYWRNTLFLEDVYKQELKYFAEYFQEFDIVIGIICQPMLDSHKARYFEDEEANKDVPLIFLQHLRYLQLSLDSFANELKEVYPSFIPIDPKRYFHRNRRAPLKEDVRNEEADIPLNSLDTFQRSSLRQKVLLIKYLDQFGYLKLSKLHQDRTKQATILSFLMANSYKTTYNALGEGMDLLKTKGNLEKALEILGIFEADFVDIKTEIKKDLKKVPL